MTKITKDEMIGVLVDEAVNPNWNGPKADAERSDWEKELKKKKWAELKFDYDEAVTIAKRLCS